MVQTRFYGNKKVLAVVVRTGFSTAKGDMIRSILFPGKLSIKFYADAMKFVLLLSVLGEWGGGGLEWLVHINISSLYFAAVAGFIYALTINLYHQYNVWSSILYNIIMIESLSLRLMRLYYVHLM